MKTPILVAIILAFAAPVGAEHCTTWSTSEEAISAGDHYVLVDPPCTPECIYGIWIYEESNGYAGLQRGDELYDGTCHGMIPADTISF